MLGKCVLVLPTHNYLKHKYIFLKIIIFYFYFTFYLFIYVFIIIVIVIIIIISCGGWIKKFQSDPIWSSGHNRCQQMLDLHGLSDLVTPSQPRRFLLPEYLPYAGIFHERGQPGLATHSSVNRVLAGKTTTTREPQRRSSTLFVPDPDSLVALLSSRCLYWRRSVSGGQQHRQHHLPPAVVGLHQVRPAGDKQRYHLATIISQNVLANGF